MGKVEEGKQGGERGEVGRGKGIINCSVLGTSRENENEEEGGEETGNGEGNVKR